MTELLSKAENRWLRIRAIEGRLADLEERLATQKAEAKKTQDAIEHTIAELRGQIRDGGRPILQIIEEDHHPHGRAVEWSNDGGSTWQRVEQAPVEWTDTTLLRATPGPH